MCYPTTLEYGAVNIPSVISLKETCFPSPSTHQKWYLYLSFLWVGILLAISFCILSNYLSIPVCICPTVSGKCHFLEVTNHLSFLLSSSLFHINLWTGGKRCSIDCPVRDQHFKIPDSLYAVQLWVSLFVIICCE